MLTIGGLVAGLGYYSDQQGAAQPPAPAGRPSVAPAPPAVAPRSNPGWPFDQQADRERARRELERIEQEGRLRELEQRQRDLERAECRRTSRSASQDFFCLAR